MTKVHLLGANRSYDRSVQTVSVNQVVVLEGYSYDSYVVHEVSRNEWGITYHLINLRTYEFHTSDLIRPLSEKFGIGIYYDDANPRFLDPLETAALLTKAKEKKAEEEKKAKETREEYGRIAKMGAERLRPLIPTDAKAVIIGTLRVNECDSYTDYEFFKVVDRLFLNRPTAVLVPAQIHTVSHAVIFPVFVICDTAEQSTATADLSTLSLSECPLSAWCHRIRQSPSRCIPRFQD